MSLKNYSRDELAETSMIELANLILLEEKKAITYQEMYDRIASMKKFTKAQKADNIAQFYTDLNTDGRFLTLGSNLWGLKRWYPVEQMDEEIHTAPKKKKAKKKKKKVVEDDFDVEIDEGLDDLDDEDLDYDDAVIDEDDDFDLDDDLDDDSDDDEEEEKPKVKADKDDSYDGDFRSGKLDDEDQEIVEEDITYTGEDDDDDANDDKKF